MKKIYCNGLLLSQVAAYSEGVGWADVWQRDPQDMGHNCMALRLVRLRGFVEAK